MIAFSLAAVPTVSFMSFAALKIDQYQSYSERAGRMVTKFVLKEKRITPTGKQKDFVILETYQLADVGKELARMYGDA